jgi:hypothetical protein
MIILDDALYERLTFGIKDDDDFSWSQDRSITLEILSNEDREIVAYRYNDDWVSCNSIKDTINKFIHEQVVTDYINASEMSIDISGAMIQAVIDLETGNLEENFGRTFTLIEGDEKITEDYDGCFFIEESYVSLNATYDEQGNVYFDGSDTLMNIEDIFDEYQDLINENTTILVVE